MRSRPLPLSLPRQRQHIFKEQLRAGGIGQQDALVRQRRGGVIPAPVEFADEVGLGHADIVKKGLVERCRPGHLPQGFDGDAWAFHIHDQIADATMLRGVRIGAHEEKTEVGIVGATRPNLLPVDDEIVPIFLSPRLQARQVGPGVGFGIALAPDVFCLENGL